MPGFHRSIVVRRPIEQVFHFATDLKNASILLPGVTRTEMITGGGMEAGAKFREWRGAKGKEHVMVIEVVEHQRPNLHVAKAAMMGMQAAFTFRFSPDPLGTLVDMDAVVQGNFLWWPFLGMMTRMMEKSDGEYLVRLKDAMERP